MEVRHRLSINGDHQPGFKSALDERGIVYSVSPLPGARIGLVSFTMEESSLQWPFVEELIRTQGGAADFYDTFFSSDEILSASWLRLAAKFEQGYPQPESSWDMTTYADKCLRCGAGFRQVAPFRLKKEPHLGKSDFMSLYWTSTLFCVPRVTDALRREWMRGYEVWDAILKRSGEPSQMVRQLVISAVADPALCDGEELAQAPCPACGTAKYNHHRRGLMRLDREALLPGMDFQLTAEWFGSGAMLSGRPSYPAASHNWHSPKAGEGSA